MRRREFVASLVILAGLAAGGTLFATRAFPIWDDAWLELLVLDEGASGVSESVLDRPLAGRIWEWLVVERDSFYLKAAAAHWLVSFGMAWFTLYIAGQLFPNRPALALSTACLAATTFLCRAQIVLAIQPIAPGLSAVTAFLAIFLIAGTIPARLPAWNTAARWLAGSAVLAIGGLISEYFVASALAGIAWILFLGLGAEQRARTRSYRAGLVLFLLTLAIYFVYHQMSSAEARQVVRPESFLLEGLSWRAKVTLPVWVSTIYVGCMGAMLDRIGSLRMLNYTDVASVAAGIMLAIVTWLPFIRRGAEPEQTNAGFLEPRLLAGSIMAVAFGVLPLVVMGRRPDLATFTSRFWTPVVPFALCASVGLLASLLRQNRLWILPPLCALLAGWALVSDGIPAANELQRVSAWGPTLRQHLGDEGISVAIFENGWEPAKRPPADYELTARLARDWSADERRRFWAFPNLSAAIDEDTSVGIGLHTKTSGIDIDRKLHSPTINRSARGLDRNGPIRRLLWVYVTPSNELQIRAVDVAGKGTSRESPSTGGDNAE